MHMRTRLNPGEAVVERKRHLAALGRMEETFERMPCRRPPR
jgi:hypothetical protein